MSDVIYIAVLLAFFVLCALYVQLCDRMIGPDDPALDGAATGSVVERGPETVVSAPVGTETGVTA